MEETAATKELKQMFTQIRDERRMYANTSSRIGDAFLSLLSYLDSFKMKDDDIVSRQIIGDIQVSYDSANGALALTRVSDSTKLASLYASGGLTAYGAGSGTSGGGTSYDRLDKWSDYTTDKATYVLSAFLGNDLNTRVSKLENSTLTSVDWSIIVNKPSTFAPSAHAHLWADITDHPTKLSAFTNDAAFITASAIPTKLSAFTNDAGFVTSIGWSDITNKPSTFTPSAHTHVWADITDAPTKLSQFTNDIHAATLNSLVIGDIKVSYDSTNGALALTRVSDSTKLASLYTTGGLTAYGAGSGTSGGGTSYNRLDKWSDYTTDKATYILSALLGDDLNTRVTKLESSTLTSVDWSIITGKPSTFTPSAHTHVWADITDHPIKLSAFTNDAAFITASAIPTKLSAFTNDAGFVTSIGWSDITNKPSTFTPSAHTHSFGSLTSVPTTLAGYGITDANISGGIITLGTNSITPLTQHQDISGKSDIKHTHTVKINGTTKTIAATGGTAVDLGTYLTSHQSLSAYPTATQMTAAINNAVGTLDVASVGGSGKYLQAISETDGKISASVATLPTKLSQFTDDILSGHYLSLSGGTMSGTALIQFADDGAWAKSNSGVTFPVKRGGLYWTGESDWVKLFTEETGSDNLDLIIQFGGDNSNRLQIRNASGSETAYITATGVFGGTFSGNASSASKVNNVLSWSGYSSGSFNGSLSASISIPTKVSQLTNDSGYLTPSSGFRACYGVNVDLSTTNDYYGCMTTHSGITSDWWHIINMSWGTGDINNWNSQLALPTEGRNGIYYRSINGANINTASWVKLLDTNNYSSYALPLSGGTINGNINIGNFDIIGSNGARVLQNLGGNLGINPANNVGIGTTSPSYKLDVAGTGRFQGDLVIGNTVIHASGSNGGINSIQPADDYIIGDCNIGGTMGLKSLNTATAGIAFYNSSSNHLGTLTASGSGLAWTGNILATGGVTAYTTSDRRLKKNIRSIDSLGVIRSLGGTFAFEYKKDNRSSIGFIAQNVWKSELSDMVRESDGYLRINYLDTRLISLALGASMELDDEVTKLKKRVSELETEVERLKAA